ncbi:MAG: hypothetical protein M3Y35_00495 [Actinomycetota bacterium]|nr:hypothetical protein [Actinomycetota bacterium]
MLTLKDLDAARLSAYVHDELADGALVGIGGPRNNSRNTPPVPQQHSAHLAVHARPRPPRLTVVKP